MHNARQLSVDIRDIEILSRDYVEILESSDPRFRKRSAGQSPASVADEEERRILTLER